MSTIEMDTTGEERQAAELSMVERVHKLSELTMLRIKEIVNRAYRQGYLQGYEDATVKAQEVHNRVVTTLTRER